jgi:hypothetical protein
MGHWGILPSRDKDLLPFCTEIHNKMLSQSSNFKLYKLLKYIKKANLEGETNDVEYITKRKEIWV